MTINYTSDLLVNFGKLGLFAIVTFTILFIISLLSIYLTPNNPDTEKLSTYECGFEPYEDARDIFDVRFYLVAILFLVFDLEAAYFFPWAVALNGINYMGFLFMVEFIFELLVGYVYAWKMGAFDWED